MDDNKKRTLSIRLSEQEKQELEKRAGQVKMTTSEYCRQLLLRGKPADDVDRQALGRIACEMYELSQTAETMEEFQRSVKGEARAIWLLIK